MEELEESVWRELCDRKMNVKIKGRLQDSDKTSTDERSRDIEEGTRREVGCERYGGCAESQSSTG